MIQTNRGKREKRRPLTRSFHLIPKRRTEKKDAMIMQGEQGDLSEPCQVIPSASAKTQLLGPTGEEGVRGGKRLHPLRRDPERKGVRIYAGKAVGRELPQGKIT